MPEILTIAQWTVLALAAFMYGFGKTGILGSAVVTTPVLLILFSPGDVLGITLPLLVLADIGALAILRGSANMKHVFRALPWAFAGIVLGWLFARYAVSLPGDSGDLLLKKTIAGILLFLIGFGLLLKFRPGIVSPESAANSHNNTNKDQPVTNARSWFVIAMGILGGTTTMLANNGGPAWVVYLMNLRLGVKEFLGTAAWLFFFQNLVKIPFGVSLGFISSGTLALTLYLIPPVVLGLLAGVVVVRHLRKDLFDNLTQAATLIGAVYILLS